VATGATRGDRKETVPAAVSQHPLPGHALVTRRALAELVQQAAATSYGVVGFAAPNPVAALLALVGRGVRGVRVRIVPTMTVELFLRVAFGVPIAEVASNVEAAVRYAVRQALGRDIDAITIHVDGLLVRPAPRGGDRRETTA
jgi:uncharacterized alkaline shock family protein YloU